MPCPPATRKFRFAAFEADPASGELRKLGTRIRLSAQPFQVLLLLLERPGELLTREEIARHLWPGDTFVDYEHGLNSAVNRIREALGDTAANPRFIETVARRGYRFLAPVEILGTQPEISPVPSPPAPAESNLLDRFLATPHDLPRAPQPLVKTLFILLQLMYLGFYIGALANLPEIEDLLSVLTHEGLLLTVILVTAALMIPVRAFVISAALFHPPQVRHKLLTLWPLLLALDILWALSPFLLLHHINFGLALACTALLVYAPFAQRSLILMGAAEPPTLSAPAS